MEEVKITQAQLLVNKADKLDLLALESKVNDMEVGEDGETAGLATLKAQMETANNDIAGLKTSVGTASNTATEAKTLANENKTALVEKADKTALNDLATKTEVAAVDGKFTAVNEAIAKKADVTALTSVDTKAGEAKTLAGQVQSDLTALTNTVNGKASSADLTALQEAITELTNRVAALETPAS